MKTAVTVYADVLFLVNFSLDFIILYITGRLFYIPQKIWRLSLSSLIGSGYAVATTVYPGNRLVQAFLLVSVSVVMCLIAFHPGDIKTLIKEVIFFYIASALFAGGVSLLYRLFSLFYRPSVMGGGSISFWFYPASLLFSLILYLTQRIYQKYHHCTYADAIVTIGDCDVRVHCMVDSGNRLKEPISALPVVVCKRALFEPYDAQIVKRLRIIPAKTISGNDLLYGFRADRIVIRTDNRQWEREAVIALRDIELENNCEGILPSALVGT